MSKKWAVPFVLSDFRTSVKSFASRTGLWRQQGASRVAFSPPRRTAPWRRVFRRTRQWDAQHVKAKCGETAVSDNARVCFFSVIPRKHSSTRACDQFCCTGDWSWSCFDEVSLFSGTAKDKKLGSRFEYHPLTFKVAIWIQVSVLPCCSATAGVPSGQRPLRDGRLHWRNTGFMLRDGLATDPCHLSTHLAPGAFWRQGAWLNFCRSCYTLRTFHMVWNREPGVNHRKAIGKIFCQRLTWQNAGKSEKL